MFFIKLFRSVFFELLMGVEPMTSSLPRKCSTTELQQQKVFGIGIYIIFNV